MCANLFPFTDPLRDPVSIQEFALSAPLTEFVPGSAPPSIVPLRLPPSSKTKRSVAEPPVRFWMFVKPATKTGVGSGFSTKRLKYPPFGPSILHSVVASGPMIVLAPSPPSRTPLSRPLMSNVNVSSPAAASMSSILMKLIPCAVKAPSPLIAHERARSGLTESMPLPPLSVPEIFDVLWIKNSSVAEPPLRFSTCWNAVTMCGSPSAPIVASVPRLSLTRSHCALTFGPTRKSTPSPPFTPFSRLPPLSMKNVSLAVPPLSTSMPANFVNSVNWSEFAASLTKAIPEPAPSTCQRLSKFGPTTVSIPPPPPPFTMPPVMPPLRRSGRSGAGVKSNVSSPAPPWMFVKWRKSVTKTVAFEVAS